MKTLHIAPGDSAGGALRAAIREAGRDEEVLAFRDDLSCGPIDTDQPASRARWWSSFGYDAVESERTFREFWDCVTETTDRLVVWFGRHSASELAFFHAFADRLGERHYEIIDVAGFRFPMIRPGSSGLGMPTQAVGMISVTNLQSFLGSERPIGEELSRRYAGHWRMLKEENAPFRIVTANGLISAPLEHFDHSILERATDQWKGVFHVIGEAIAYNSEPYLQVGDLMLLARITTLIEQEKLLADGDTADPRNCRIRLPD